MKWLGEVLIPLIGMLVYGRVNPTPSIKIIYTHSYTWVDRGSVRVIKYLIQEHNTMTLARA